MSLTTRNLGTIRCAGLGAVCGLVGGLVFGVGVPRVWAGPLDGSRVDREAVWLFHVDMEAAERSLVGTTLDRVMKKAEPDEKAQAFKALEDKLGLDPEKDLRGVTIYGFTTKGAMDVGPGRGNGRGERRGDGRGVKVENGAAVVKAELPDRLEHPKRPDDAVVVFETTEWADQLKDRLPVAGLQEFAVGEHAGVATYAATIEGDRWLMAVMPVRGDGARRLCVIAPTSEHLHRAIDVVMGSRAGLGETKGAMPGMVSGAVEGGDSKGVVAVSSSPREGSVLFGWIRKMDGLSKDDANARVIRDATNLWMELGEGVNAAGKRELFTDLRMGAGSEESAMQMKQVVQGLLAMASLGLDPKVPAEKEAMLALNGFQVEAAESAMTVKGRHDAERVAKMIEEVVGGAIDRMLVEKKGEEEKAKSEEGKVEEKK